MQNKKMKLAEFKTGKTSLQLIFKSPEARTNWKQNIKQLASQSSSLELLSVARGHRPCAWQAIRESTLFDFIKKCSDMGLFVLPIKRVGRWNGFIHYTPPPEQGKDNNIYCIISKNLEDAVKFRDAHFSGDHKIQGEMLGFPACCSEFFSKQWDRGYFDMVYQSYQNSKEAHPLSNPLLRYIGIRASFHIPCSFACEKTIGIGEQRISLMDKHSRQLILFLLSLDVTWSCLHGIAEVNTDLFKIVTGTVPTNEKYSIEVKGLVKTREGW